jgi:hypothetical protein
MKIIAFEELYEHVVLSMIHKHNSSGGTLNENQYTTAT